MPKLNTTPFNSQYTGDYILNNVRLESGFDFDPEFDRDPAYIRSTRTIVANLKIQAGKIGQISTEPLSSVADTDLKTFDGQGKLMLPFFKDMHTHLDKSLYGLPWQAVSPRRKTVYDMIAYEQQIIDELLQSSVDRSTKLIALMQGFGTGFARSHFNVDPTSGLRSLEHLLTTLEDVKDRFEAELVAFPQHGVFYTDSAQLLREAACLDAVSYIGGVDPYGVDGAIEKVLDYTVSLALEYNKGIDLHLHDGGQQGLDTINHLAKLVQAAPALKGRTFISHAYVLASLTQKQLQEVAETLHAADIAIVSAIPLAGGTQLPIPRLRRYGVKVLVGTDNIQDHWSTFGSGSMLEQVHFMARIYGWQSEYELSRALAFATGGVVPLSDLGERIWPLEGQAADFILLDASASAEVVARRSPVVAFAKNGHFFTLH